MDFHSCFVSDYNNDELKADLIVISHVMYYCIDDYYDVIKKALSWLNPGGVLINVCILADKYTDFFGMILSLIDFRVYNSCILVHLAMGQTWCRDEVRTW